MVWMVSIKIESDSFIVFKILFILSDFLKSAYIWETEFIY